MNKLPAWLFEGMHTPLKPQMFLWVTQILLLCDSPVWTYSFPKLIPHWSPRQMFPIMSLNAGRHRAEMISTFILLKIIYSYKWDGFKFMKHHFKNDFLTFVFLGVYFWTRFTFWSCDTPTNSHRAEIKTFTQVIENHFNSI